MENSSASSLNRRELLKVLAAASGGMVAAAFVPGKWLKPVVEAGVLPAHAQGTDTLVLQNLVLMQFDDLKAPSAEPLVGTVEYMDILGQVGSPPNTVLHASVTNGYIVDDNFDYYRTGTPYSGVFHFNCAGSWYCPAAFNLYLTVGSRISNTESKELCSTG